MQIGGTSLHVMKAFFFVGEEVVSKYKRKKKHTHSAGECFTNMDKLSIRHMKHIFLSLLTKLI